MRALSRWEVIINFTSLLQKTHENMSPCTGFNVNTNYERIASRAGCQLRTRALMSQATPRPTAGSSVLETQPWPIRQKRIGTSRMVHVGITHPAQQSILGRNDSPLGHLYLALAYRYFFYGGGMGTCFRAVTSGWIPIMSWMFHMLDARN